MTTALKNVAFKMDSDTLDLASEVIKENGYNLNKVMRLYLKNVAITKKIDLPTEEELDNEFLFMQLKRVKLNKGFQMYRMENIILILIW